MKKVIYSSIVFLLAFIVITACVHGNTAPAKPSDTVKAKQTQRSHFLPLNKILLVQARQVLLKPQLLEKTILQLLIKQSPLNL